MSAAPAKTADPSMEDILASIRRIIADDDDSKLQAAEVERSGSSPSLDEEPEDVLDLVTMDQPAQPDTSLEIDLPDLSFQPAMEPEPQTEPEPPPSEPPQPDPGALAAAVAASVRDAAAEPRPTMPPAEPSFAQPPQQDRVADGLVSQETTASVGQAFNLLSHTIMSQNATTLEDMVREMLRPMLKTWLDDNLPPLVERLVAAEIQRVARGQR